MARAEKLYHRLPGRGFRGGFGIAATRTSLWRAPDHLLHIETTPGSESYRRFYFRDIEALLIRRTGKWQLWNWINGLLTLASAALVLWLFQQDNAAYAVAVVPAAFFLILFVANGVRGPTCTTHIRTAVQLEDLPSLNRLSVARKVLARVRPLIEQAQVPLDATRLAGAEWISAAAANRSTRSAGSQTGATRPIRHESGKVHAWLFAMLLVHAAAVFFDAAQATPLSTGINLLTLMAAFALFVVALGRQQHSDLPVGVRRLTWAVLGYFVAAVTATMGFVFIHSFRRAQEGLTPDALINLQGEPGFTEAMFASGAISIALGVCGLLLLLARRNSKTTPPPLA